MSMARNQNYVQPRFTYHIDQTDELCPANTETCYLILLSAQMLLLAEHQYQ
jgi:hypothetical protein